MNCSQHSRSHLKSPPNRHCRRPLAFSALAGPMRGVAGAISTARHCEPAGALLFSAQMNFLSMARKLGPSGWLPRPAVISAIVVAALVGAIARPVNPSETDPATALISRARAALGHGEIKSLHLAGIFNSGDINGTVETWIDVADGRF